MRHACLALPLLICSGCVPMFPVIYETHYVSGLVEVQRPASAQDRYGPSRITAIGDSAAFEDGMVRLVAILATDRVAFSLTNKTPHTIKILWSDAAYIDVQGQSHPVMHVGVKYTECTSTKAPSSIVQDAHLEDEIIPCSNVRMRSYPVGWVVDPLLPGAGATQAADTAKMHTAAQALVGRRIRVLLPIQIQDVTNDYVLAFEIRAATLTLRQ